MKAEHRLPARQQGTPPPVRLSVQRAAGRQACQAERQEQHCSRDASRCTQHRSMKTAPTP